MATMISPLRRAVLVGADRPAVRCGAVELTYAETWERCRRLAGALRGLGLEEGDRVGIVSPNCHRYLEVYQAVPGAGMVLVPLNHRWADAELRYALEDSGARVLFAGRPVTDVPTCVEHVIDAGDGYEALLDHAAPAEFPGDVGEDDLAGFPGDAAEDDLAGLFYTGGTTGASKGVMLRHRSLVANAFHFQASLRFGADTCFLLVAPMFHLAGTIAVLATVWHGGRQVVMKAFDAGAMLDLIERERVTVTQVVPTMLAALNDEQLARPRDVSSLRVLTFGGAPSATETLRRARRAFPDAELMTMYGATETAPLVTTLPGLHRLLDAPQAHSCGRPAIGVEVKVVADDGGVAAPGEVGEVTVRGPNVMAGYWNKPDQTQAVLRDGWYSTGDLGRMDEEGYLYLVDRAKDMIVTGGENVYSTEVEDVLFRHPAVLEAAVFGVPDERWGEAVHAVVVRRADADPSPDELVAWCREAIAGYKVPKRIELRAEPLPKSGAGKVLKRELRAPYWDGREASVSGA
jgi:long-chain acyl-CoA synthetase